MYLFSNCLLLFLFCSKCQNNGGKCVIFYFFYRDSYNWLTSLMSKNTYVSMGTVKIVQKYKSIKVQKFNGKLSPVITNTLAVEILCAVPVRPMRFTLFFAVKKIKILWKIIEIKPNILAVETSKIRFSHW